jgi:hypothetical protein
MVEPAIGDGAESSCSARFRLFDPDEKPVRDLSGYLSGLSITSPIQSVGISTWRCTMKNLLIATAIATLIALPAFAQSEFDSRTERPAQARDGATSLDVYKGNKLIGRDPDPNVRFELRRDNYGQR